MTIRVTIWNEFIHEQKPGIPRTLYPAGIHQAIASGLEDFGEFKIQTATLGQPEHGLSEAVLDQTDVLVWWAHLAHDQVEEKIVDRVHRRVLSGMGLVVLHSSHYAKIFQRLMGTWCSLNWREANDRERLWNLAHAHPIMEGIPDYFELENEEMYGERFDIPQPDELLMISWFSGGEVFRSLCTWKRGHGRIVYFRPGHETFPTYHHPLILRILANACRYSAAVIDRPVFESPNAPPVEQKKNEPETD